MKFFKIKVKAFATTFIYFRLKLNDLGPFMTSVCFQIEAALYILVVDVSDSAVGAITGSIRR